jgi:hypothetical protein
MAVRYASFNVENLFARPRALNQATWAQGRPILEAYAAFNALIELPAYGAADKARMVELLVQLDVYRNANGVLRRNRTPTPKWAWLRANRGSFDVDHADTGIEVVANGRGAWTGWLELATEPVDETNTRTTATVIHDVAADVQAVIEAEDRPSLDRFNHDLLAGQFGHVMLIDGNDPRGIDVGVMTTTAVEITAMRSHVDAPDPGAPGEHLFSRDCAAYQCRLPSGATVWVLVNHFKSQSGGGGPKRPPSPGRPRHRRRTGGRRRATRRGDGRPQRRPRRHRPASRQPGPTARPQRPPGRGLRPARLQPRAPAGHLPELHDPQPLGLRPGLARPRPLGRRRGHRTARPVGHPSNVNPPSQ